MLITRINKLNLFSLRNNRVFSKKLFSIYSGEKRLLLTNSFSSSNQNTRFNFNNLLSQNINLQQTRCFSFQPFLESIVNGQANIFKSISESKPVEYAQDYLHFIHDFTGLPWWCTIILGTCLLRTVITLPLALYQNYILAKVENIQVELKQIVPELKKETTFAIKKFNWDLRYAQFIYRRSLKKQWRLMIERENCHPLKATILLWFQIPMWVCFSVAIRNMVYMQPTKDLAAEIVAKELSLGGVAWFPNLLIPDESLILPLTFGILSLCIVEIQSMSRLRQSSKLQNAITNFFRIFAVFMIPVAAIVPSSLSLYWVSSTAFGLMQNLILLSPRLKKLAHIPNSPSQLDKPYGHIAEQIRARARFLNSRFIK